MFCCVLFDISGVLVVYYNVCGYFIILFMDVCG